MKKICFISQCSLPIPTVKGGAVETLVEYLIEENEKNPKYEFTVISVDDEQAEALSGKYKYTKFLYVPAGNQKADKILFEAARVLKHAGINLPSSIAFNKALKVLRTIEDQDLFVYEAGPTTHLMLLEKIIPREKLIVHLHWDGMGNRRKDRCFSYLLPVSRYIGERWQKATGCSWDKIKPLYNCTDTERFTRKLSEAEAVQLKRQLGIEEKNKIIIFTGRIVEEKGVKELLKAYSQIKLSDVTLIIIGSANFGAETKTGYEGEIETLISEIDKPIIFTGYVHQTQLYKYYSIADVAVMPSLFEDPAPLVSIETQASGTPLIATKVGGIPEYAGEGGVMLIEKDDSLADSLTSAMETLLRDNEKRESMSQCGIRNAMRFTVQRYFEEFSDILNNVIS